MFSSFHYIFKKSPTWGNGVSSVYYQKYVMPAFLLKLSFFFTDSEAINRHWTQQSILAMLQSIHYSSQQNQYQTAKLFLGCVNFTYNLNSPNTGNQ